MRREEEDDQGQQESPPEVRRVIINDMKLQLAADISYSKRSASRCTLHSLIWKGGRCCLPIPHSLPLAVSQVPLAFLFSLQRGFFLTPCTHTPSQPRAPTPTDARGRKDRAHSPGLHSPGSPSSGLLQPKPNAPSAIGKDKRANQSKPDRTFAILVSESFYLKCSSLEETPPLVDAGWRRSQLQNLGNPTLSGLVQT